MYVDPAGERIDFWDREVTYQKTLPLAEAMSSDKMLKYNLLLSILINDEKLSPEREGRFYASGSVKEIRVGRTAYRIAGMKYLGKQTVKLQLGEK